MPDYIILRTGNTRELEEIVSRKLSEGYQLAGGVAVTSIPSPLLAIPKNTYTQAMVKP